MGSTEERERPIGAVDLWLLAALTCFSLFLLLEPLLGFTLFGSDTGEYYRLSAILASQGRLPIGEAFTGGYTGWGFAYMDFPGLFVLTASAAGALGIGLFPALTLWIPAVTALSVLPLFLLFRRLYPHDTVAILGAGFATVLMPRLFSIAHPAPLALGDLFVVAGLWLFVEGRRDRRFYAPLAIVGATLILTHHLSSYFFLLSAAGGLLLLELWRPGSWSRRLPVRELAFLGAFLTGMLVYWFDYAVDFHTVLQQGGIPPSLVDDPVPLIAVGWAALAFAGLLIRTRRRRPGRHPLRVRFPTGWVVLRDGLVIGGATVAGLLVLLRTPLPATSQTITPAMLLYFAPVFLFVAFAAGARRTLSLSRLGPWTLTWLAAIGLSALFALGTNNPVLLPSRHAEYLVIPLGLVVAATFGYLAIRAEGWIGWRGVVAVGLGAALLLGANAAVAYPPPSDLGGFEEGLTGQDAALWMWVGTTLPPGEVVATAHPLSSMIFGFDGLHATWQDTPALFLGSNWSEAAAELRAIPAPHCPYLYPVDIVAIDAAMRSGVALNPGALAQPMSPSAVAWFGGAPFVPIYENGAQTVYWIDGPVGSSVASNSCTATAVPSGR